mgnify:CR=1 FL=1
MRAFTVCITFGIISSSDYCDSSSYASPWSLSSFDSDPSSSESELASLAFRFLVESFISLSFSLPPFSAVSVTILSDFITVGTLIIFVVFLTPLY